MATRRKHAPGPKKRPPGESSQKEHAPHRAPTSRLRKIPLPPVPTFLHGAGKPRAPRETSDPPVPAALMDGANTDEEADLILGGSLPDLTIPGNGTPGGAPSPEAADNLESGITGEESDGLLESLAAPNEPERSGASGATVLNELVDEIQKDLARDLDRHAPPIELPVYRHTIGCWSMTLGDDIESDFTESKDTCPKEELE